MVQCTIFKVSEVNAYYRASNTVSFFSFIFTCIIDLPILSHYVSLWCYYGKYLIYSENICKKTKWNIGNHNKSNIFKTQCSCSFNVLTGNMNNKENRQNKPLSTSLSLMKPIILWTLHIFNLRLKCLIDIIQLRYTFLYNGILLNLWIRFLSNETALSLFSSDWSDNVANTIGTLLLIWI